MVAAVSCGFIFLSRSCSLVSQVDSLYRGKREKKTAGPQYFEIRYIYDRIEDVR